MNTLRALAAFLFFLPAVTALGQWTRTTGPDAGPVNVIVPKPSGNDVFAGTYGGVARSTDDGVTWFEATDSLPTNFSVSGIAFSGTVIYACGTSPSSGGGVYKSTNDGGTWTLATGTGLPSGIFAVVNDVAVSGSRVMVGVYNLLGAHGVYASTDGGATWATSNSGLPAGYVPSRFFNYGSWVYVGSTGASSSHGIYRSTDDGVTWTAASGGFPTTSFETGFAAIGGTIFAATHTAGVWRSTDNGANWTKISPTSPVLIPGANSLAASSTNLYIGGGRIWKADGNGENWTEVITGLPTPNAGTSTPTLARRGGTLLAAVSKLGVYRSIADGTDWTASNAGLRIGKINSLYATGSWMYAAENTSGYSRTIDGGATWERINSGFDVANANGYYGFAESGGFLMGGVGLYGVLRSSDGGSNWLTTTGMGAAPAYSLLADGGEVFAGTLGNVMKSTDDGASWTALTTGITGFAVVGSLYKDGSMMIAMPNGGVKRSTDGGATWTAPITGIPVIGNPHGIVKLDTVLYLAHDGGLYRSFDNGASWATAGSGIGLGNPLLSIRVSGQYLYAGTKQGVYRCSSPALAWQPMNEGFPPGMIVNTLTDDGTYMFAGTDYHGVWRRPLSELTHVREERLVGLGVPREAALDQNYPNPFNPATTIRYRVPRASRVSLVVYNGLGEQVATLVDGRREPGHYSAVWDATGFPSGVYFAELRIEAASFTRKLMLVR